MKYIKLFDSKENLYQQIDRSDYYNCTDMIDMSMNNVNYLIDLLKDKNAYHFTGSRRYKNNVATKQFSTEGFSLDNRILHIIELEDDYFIIEVIYPNKQIYPYYYKCDGREGVINCLKYIRVI
jgi:hypothetical protein